MGWTYTYTYGVAVNRYVGKSVTHRRVNNIRSDENYFPIKAGLWEASRLLMSSRSYRNGHKNLRKVMTILVQLNSLAGNISAATLKELAKK